MEDLTQWAGQEVRLSLVLSIEPSYTKVGTAERWDPSEISANIFSAELMACTFKVTLGKMEEENPSPGTVQPGKRVGRTSSQGINKPLISNATIDLTTNTLETVLDGSQSSHGYLANPSDFPLCSEQIPAYSYTDGQGQHNVAARYVCYLTARRWDGHTDHGAYGYIDAASAISEDSVYGACSRVIDFCTESTLKLNSASVSQIQGYLQKDAAGNAIAVLKPSGDSSRNFDDHWVGISSVRSMALSDSTKTLHAFYNAEDHFKDIDGATGDHNINYDGNKYYPETGYGKEYADYKYVCQATIILPPRRQLFFPV
ncbi:MAG: hypothetical protein AB1656_09415 [Candidatus Omnitrophota bacterium]